MDPIPTYEIPVPQMIDGKSQTDANPGTYNHVIAKPDDNHRPTTRGQGRLCDAGVLHNPVYDTASPAYNVEDAI